MFDSMVICGNNPLCFVRMAQAPPRHVMESSDSDSESRDSEPDSSSSEEDQRQEQDQVEEDEENPDLGHGDLDPMEPEEQLPDAPPQNLSSKFLSKVKVINYRCKRSARYIS